MNNCKTFLHMVFFLSLTLSSLSGAEQSGLQAAKGLCTNTLSDETSMVYVKPKMVSGLKKFDLTLVLIKKKPRLQTDRKFYHGFDCFSGNAGTRTAYFCKGEIEGGAQILLSVSQAEEGFQVVWKTRESEADDFSSLDWGSGFQCNLNVIIKDSLVGPQSKKETINRAASVSSAPPILAGKEEPPKETEGKIRKSKKEETSPEVVYWDPEEDAKKSIVSRKLSSPKGSNSSDFISESESSNGAQ